MRPTIDLWLQRRIQRPTAPHLSLDNSLRHDVQLTGVGTMNEVGPEAAKVGTKVSSLDCSSAAQASHGTYIL